MAQKPRQRPAPRTADPAEKPVRRQRIAAGAPKKSAGVAPDTSAAAPAEGPRQVDQADHGKALLDDVEAEPAATEAGESEAGEIGLDPDVDALADEPADEASSTKAIVPARRGTLAVPPKERAATPVDLLQRYMAEVSRYGLLTREEELALTRKYRDTQDPAVAYRLVTANLRLVVKIAWEYRRAAFNLLDLIQEGNVGLMQGVKKYDPERGVKLSSYVAWWIRAYIIRYLMDNWRMVKLGTTQAQRKIFFNLRKEKERLAAQGFAPEPKLLAQRLNVTEQDVVDMDRRLSNDEFSLDTPVSDDSATTFGDRLASGGQAVDDRLAEQEIGTAFREKLVEFARTLADKERFIYEKRLIADEPMTLQEVGDHFGVSRERARQIEARLTQKLKAYMREHLPDFEQLSLEPRDE